MLSEHPAARRQFLHRVRCPALVLTGDDDPLIRTVNARLLARLLPNATMQVVKGGGHLFMLFSAEETARLIRDFMATSAADADAAILQAEPPLAS